jgi:hypothetical protein
MNSMRSRAAWRGDDSRELSLCGADRQKRTDQQVETDAPISSFHLRDARLARLDQLGQQT